MGKPESSGGLAEGTHGTHTHPGNTGIDESKQPEIAYPDFVARLPAETGKEVIEVSGRPVSKRNFVIFMAGLIDQAYVPPDKQRSPAAGSITFVPALINGEYLTLPPEGRNRISKEALVDFVRDMVVEYQGKGLHANRRQQRARHNWEKQPLMMDRK